MMAVATYSGISPGMAKATVQVVIKNLSAAGSNIDPSTDFMLHLRAIYPSTKSVTQEYVKIAIAGTVWLVAKKYPINGVAAILESVSMFGTVYISVEMPSFGLNATLFEPLTLLSKSEVGFLLYGGTFTCLRWRAFVLKKAVCVMREHLGGLGLRSEFVRG